VTIIAGFRCSDGIVICADTQETLGSAKRDVPKLRFEPSDPLTEVEDYHSNLAAAFCGAGDGPYIDKLVSEAWKQAKDKKGIAEVCEAIEYSIKEQYREFGAIYQQGACPEVQLIFGVKMNGESRLFSAMGPIVNEKFGFDSGGVGHYMADFLAGKMHFSQMSSMQCAILAAYILFEAKTHVDGCGGDSQIAVLRNSGTSGMVSWARIDKITDLIQVADDTASEILMAIANADQSDKWMVDEIEFRLGLMYQLRTSIRNEIQRQESPELYKSLDFLGLPLPKEKSPG